MACPLAIQAVVGDRLVWGGGGSPLVDNGTSNWPTRLCGSNDRPDRLLDSSAGPRNRLFQPLVCTPYPSEIEGK